MALTSLTNDANDGVFRVQVAMKTLRKTLAFISKTETRYISQFTFRHELTSRND